MKLYYRLNPLRLLEQISTNMAVCKQLKLFLTDEESGMSNNNTSVFDQCSLPSKTNDNFLSPYMVGGTR